MKDGTRDEKLKRDERWDSVIIRLNWKIRILIL